MMLQLKVIWHLLNLCAIAFAWNVQGSTGFSVFASVEEQNHVYTPSASPFLNGSFVQPPLSSHLLEPPPPRRANIPTVSPTQSAVTQSAASPKPLTSFPPSQKPTPTPSQPINVPNPASTTAPLPHVKPHSSVPVNPPSTTYHGSSTSHPAISPSTSSLSPPVLPLHSSVVPPPLPSVSAFSPTHGKTPRHLPSPSPLVQVLPSAMPSTDSGFSPRNLVPSHSLAPPPLFVTPLSTTPSPVSAPPANSNHHPSPQYPLPLPAHIVLSPSSEAAPNATIPIQSLPPLPPIPPIPASIPPNASSSHPDVAPSTPAEPQFSAPPTNSTNQPPEAAPPTVSDAAPPPSHDVASSPPPAESHFSAPPPTPLVHPPNPPPYAVPPTVSLPPPEAAPPSHGMPSSPPTESLFSAPPPKPPSSDAAPPPESHFSVPPPDPTKQPSSSPPPDAVPPTVALPPPSAAPPSHDAASSPPAESLSAPPPKPVPTVSSPPPNAAPPSHNVASSPPPKPVPTVSSPPPNAAPPSHDVASSPPAVSLSAPPPKPVPPTVSSPPPSAAPPSHGVASSPPAESFSAPPTKPVPPTVSSPPPNAAPPSHDVASSPPAESFSAPPPNPVPPPNAAPPSQNMASSPPAESLSSPPPKPVPPTVPSPPPNAAPPPHDVASSPTAESLSFPPPKPIPTVFSPPPNAVPPSHDVGSSPPAESLSAPTPKSVPTVSSPPPNAAPPPSHGVASTPPESHSAPPPNPLIHTPNPPPDAVPPAVSLPPPEAPPTHDVAPSSPAESHFSAPPPTTSAAHAPNPPPDAVPPTVSLPPPRAPPSHDLAQPPAFVSAPPPTSSSISKNASHPPIGSVPSHATAPSIAAEPPITASPPIIHTFPTAPLPPVISNSSAPLGAPPVRSPPEIPVLPSEPPSAAPEAQLPRMSSPAPSIDHIGDRVPVPVAPIRPTHPLSPTHEPPEQGFSPSTAPSIQKPVGIPSLPPVATSSPPISQTAETAHSPSLSPIPSITPTHNSTESISPETSFTVPSPAPKQQGHPLLAPAPASHNPGSSAATAPAQSPLTEDYLSPVPMLTVPVTSGHSLTPSVSPEISPPTSEPIIELAPPILALPPPPPNQDCLSYTCLDPYTNTIPGSPCGCVLPMRVELRIGVALYTFFPLVPEFAHEVATAIFMKQSQVRVMGANAASDKPDKTLLLVDLVPLSDKFDNITAFLIFERFWNHQVDISKSLFGDYEVLYVQYPGLPASPPMAPSDIAAINGGPYPGENGSKINPLGVDVTKQRHNHRISGSLIAIIVFSAVGAMLMFLLLGWILLFRHRRSTNQSAEAAHVHPSSIARSTGPTGQSGGSRPSFSLSFESSVAAYSGSAKTFSAAEIERATDNFNPSRVLGEGGFGLVYSATLEDGAEVAVKVLKREDQQGGREFLAEIEMLSRLHHRNLVKLIGICAEEHIHCLIYELIPNGSVESHLHGADKNTSPLDWPSRLKIALGSARGLAYLHEDSSPRVIHRDFKASNILLEADFTPKVSDFGLARTAMDEDNKHISTRVMGTFGYVAPEYAMTGHLLVKSDVYSYGVVLLELLTGRKPVDMSQPSGQENLVAWTRPYLTTKEALKSIVDPNLGPYISFESVAKVAAIASMCVQPEVSHRPFMGEVVQALKLVCNECDDSKDDSSGSTGSENEYRETRDVEKALSVSEDSCEMGPGVGCKGSGSDSFRRHSSSGPIGGGRSWRFWKRGGTTSFREDGGGGENGVHRFWSGSH